MYVDTLRDLMVPAIALVKELGRVFAGQYRDSIFRSSENLRS
jgi:hypothetical protein